MISISYLRLGAPVGYYPTTRDVHMSRAIRKYLLPAKIEERNPLVMECMN